MLPSTAKGDSPSACLPTPRGQKRRREIAAVAERMFFENGFADTTMQAIAARAGASKETLYRHFGSKEGLFAELVSDRARMFLEGLDAKFDRPGSVTDALRELGLKLLDAMVGADAISLCRTVVAESPRNPELGEIFFAAGPDRVCERLTEYLVVARSRGEFECAEPRRVALAFLGAVMSSFHLQRLLLRNPPVMTKVDMRNHVDEVVAMFMLRYAGGHEAKRCS